MNTMDVIRSMLSEGVEFTYGKLTLCDLTKYQNYRGKRRWQIFCDDKNLKFFQLYVDIDQAIEKFLELKTKIRARIR